MRSLATLAPRQVVYLWLCGLLLSPLTFVVSGWMVRPGRNAMLREIALRSDRDRRMDSAYLASLAPDTANPVLLNAWKRTQTRLRLRAHRDSILLIPARVNPADTAYDPYNESILAGRLWRAGARLAFAGAVFGVVMPVMLLGFTAWWGYRRWGASVPPS
jgi:hypothetical protein